MNNYHIDGASGSGKTTVCEELIKRGYNAVDADETVAFFGNPHTGEPMDTKGENWVWKKEITKNFLNDESNKPLFVCGGAMNSDDFKKYFKKHLYFL